MGKVTVKKGARAALLLPTVAKADNVDDPIRYAAVVLTDRLRDQVRTRRAAFLKARQADAALWYHEYRDEACVWLGADPFDAVDDKAAAVFDFVGGRLDARPGAVVAARLPAGLDLLAAELGVECRTVRFTDTGFLFECSPLNHSHFTETAEIAYAEIGLTG